MPAAIADRRGDDDVFVLEVRNEDGYEEWAIEGSHNVPVYDKQVEEDFSGLNAQEI